MSNLMDKHNLIREAAHLIMNVASNIRMIEVDELYYVELDKPIALMIHKSAGDEMPEEIINLAVLELFGASSEMTMKAMKEQYHFGDTEKGK